MRTLCFRLAAVMLLTVIANLGSAMAQTKAYPLRQVSDQDIIPTPAINSAPVMISTGSACGPNGCGTPAISGGCESCGEVAAAAPAKKHGFGLFHKKSKATATGAAPACGCSDVNPIGSCTTGCEPFQNVGCSTPHKDARFMFGGCRSFFGCPQDNNGYPYGNAPRPVTTPCDYGTFHRW